MRDIRQVARRTAARLGGTALVGGPTAIQADTWAQSNRDTIVVAIAALIVVGVILMLLLRAVVAPVFLLLTRRAPYLAALGSDDRHHREAAGVEHISYRIPLYLFIFLVALGSDYNIFITTRIRGEAMARGLRDGTVTALSATGGVLTSAGIILAGTFLILLFAAGEGPRRDQHRRGARRAHRHVPGAHRAGARSHAVDRAEGRVAGAAVDEEGAAGKGTGRRASSCSGEPVGDEA